MNVKNITEFVEDIDEYEIAEMKLEETEGYKSDFIRIRMTKTFSENMAEIILIAHKMNDDRYEQFKPVGRDNYVYESKSYYELLFDVREQEADQEAIRKIRHMIWNDELDLRQVTEIPYELEVIH